MFIFFNRVRDANWLSIFSVIIARDIRIWIHRDIFAKNKIKRIFDDLKKIEIAD